MSVALTCRHDKRSLYLQYKACLWHLPAGMINVLYTGHNLPDKSCVADTAMQIELA